MWKKYFSNTIIKQSQRNNNTLYTSLASITAIIIHLKLSERWSTGGRRVTRVTRCPGAPPATEWPSWGLGASTSSGWRPTPWRGRGGAPRWSARPPAAGTSPRSRTSGGRFTSVGGHRYEFEGNTPNWCPNFIGYVFWFRGHRKSWRL